MLHGISWSYASRYLQLLKKHLHLHWCLHTRYQMLKLLSRLMLLTMHSELYFLSILQNLILSLSTSISFSLQNSTMTFITKNSLQSSRHSRFGDTTWRAHTFWWTLSLITRTSPTFLLPRFSLTGRLADLNIYFSSISLFISAWAISKKSQMLSLDIQTSIQKRRIVAIPT